MQRSLFFIKQNSIKARIIHVSRANLNRRQAAAVTEGPSPDTGNAIRNGDARQAGAALEGQNSDPGDAIRNRDARQAGAASEEIRPIRPIRPDAGDRITINGVRNHQFTSGFSIAIGNGDFAVSCGPRQVI